MKQSFNSLGGGACHDAAPGACSGARGPLRIALAGYGVVGQALAERLRAEPGFEISAILVRRPELSRGVAPPVPATGDLDAFLAAPVDILVDVLSCAETGARLCGELLPRGIHVASASKRVVSSRHALLHAAARRGGARLLHAASVGGGAPVLETVAEAAARGAIARVSGILNGTVNFILTRLAEGRDFDDALAEARGAGFAEEDPSEDLSGADAAAKVKLIAALAFGLDPALLSVAVEPLDRAAAERIRTSGERWIQLARVERVGDFLSASVRLCRRSAVPALPPVDEEWNCVLVELASGETARCSGPGAGGFATADSILGDLRRIAAETGRAEQPLVLAC
ncbi:MAG: homoserine dehydrogenase [Allosphingosinicella sp.]|uniref:homoserine dehydrogenase n=1 Tax=Allosphingosinicella sp. TaxID=2823234 RepID=UPI00394C7BD9